MEIGYAVGICAGFLALIYLLLWQAGMISTITVPSLDIQLSRHWQSELTRAREEAKTEVERATRRARDNILFLYTDRIAALSIVAMQSMYLTRQWTDPRTGTVYPRGAYATDIVPWTPDMTQRKLAQIFYFSVRRQESADLSWFVALVNDQPPLFVPLGANQWVKPDENVNAVLAWKNPMP